jgi:diguanylate cyclase (GGDEF)-like protein/PAS domain S-box-containing protein
MQAPQPPVDEHEALLSFLYLCPIGVLQIDGQGGVQMLNPMASRLLMPLLHGAPLLNLFDVLAAFAPDLRARVTAFQPADGCVVEDYRLIVSDTTEELSVLECSITKVEPGCFMVMLNDISRQVAQERRLKQADSWLTAIFSSCADFMCFSLDCDGRIDSWNQSCIRQAGYSEAEALGRTLDMLRPADDRVPGALADELDCARREGFYIRESRCAFRDANDVWCQTLLAALKDDDDRISGFTVVVRDVSERKVTSDELRRLLTTDNLTGAANRAHFFEVAEAEVACWKHHGRPMSVLMLDADHFKRVNDDHGHAAGDVVLQVLVARTRMLLREADVLARFGGEEFVILLPGLDGRGAEAVAERIRLAIAAAPVEVEGRGIPLTVSIGCATLGGSDGDLGALLKAADNALYQAKQLGRNRTAAYLPA